MVTKKVIAASVTIKTAERLIREAKIRNCSQSYIVQAALDFYAWRNSEKPRGGNCRKGVRV